MLQFVLLDNTLIKKTGTNSFSNLDTTIREKKTGNIAKMRTQIISFSIRKLIFRRNWHRFHISFSFAPSSPRNVFPWRIRRSKQHKIENLKVPVENWVPIYPLYSEHQCLLMRVFFPHFFTDVNTQSRCLWNYPKGTRPMRVVAFVCLSQFDGKTVFWTLFFYG